MNNECNKFCDFMQGMTRKLNSILPIARFSYLEINKTGEYLYLNNLMECFAEFIRIGAIRYYPLSILQFYNIPGYYLKDNLSITNDQMVDYLRINNLGHSLYIVKQEFYKNTFLYKCYMYDALASNNNINHDYINNLDMLNAFNDYFDTELSKIKSTIKPYVIPSTSMYSLSELFNEFDNKAKDSINRKLKISCELKIFGNNFKSLSARELQVLQWYLKGKTAEETAIILGIKRHTVESFIARIKKKLNCHSKLELITKSSSLISV